jgi:UDP-N-acetylmuramate dehydrogenase
MKILENETLAPYTWYKIGGPADYMAFPESVEDVKEAIAFAHEKDIPLQVLGMGTNVLVSDKGIRGLTLCLKEMNHIEEYEEGGRYYIKAQAGVTKAKLTKHFMKKKLAPALFISGIPGDLGGGVYMNAGVSEDITPREFTEIVDEFTVVSTVKGKVEQKTFKHDDVEWSYRHTDGWKPGVIVEAILSWPNEPDATVPKQVREATLSRKDRQPLEFPSCGSVFVNPKPLFSGKLIQEAGLKGLKIGGAQISEKHANFIVNTGDAKASDVAALIQRVKDEIMEKNGVKMRTEVKFIGEWD